MLPEGEKNAKEKKTSIKSSMVSPPDISNEVKTKKKSKSLTSMFSGGKNKTKNGSVKSSKITPPEDFLESAATEGTISPELAAKIAAELEEIETIPLSDDFNDMKLSDGKSANHDGISSTSQTNVNSTQNGQVISEIVPPKGFLPFVHYEITPELVLHAKTYLNETDETRERGLREMREILKKDKDLVLTDEDRVLLLLLRSRKFDPQKAADFLKLGMNYIEAYRYLLEREDPAILRDVINANMVGFLQYRDARQRAIIYARADKWDPNTVPAADAIFAGVLAVQSAAHNPVNQISGFVVLLDLKDMKLQQLFAMSRWMIFGTITLQRACPCFMKAFHVINVPPMYKLGWKLVKPLLSEKIRKRFIFHKSSDLSTLYESIPREICPPELGGPIPFSNEHWAKDIDKIEKDYYFYLNSNYFISKRKK